MREVVRQGKGSANIDSILVSGKKKRKERRKTTKSRFGNSFNHSPRARTHTVHMHRKSKPRDHVMIACTLFSKGNKR